VACGFGMVVLGTVCVYVLVLFLPGYASRQFHLPQSAAFAITAYMSLVGAIWCVIAGWLSDRVGRKPLLMISSIGLVILTYPLFAFLAAAPSLTRLVIIETVFALLVATFAAVSPTLLAELFPTRVRNTALAISYNIAVAIFGGFGGRPDRGAAACRPHRTGAGMTLRALSHADITASAALPDLIPVIAAAM